MESGSYETEDIILGFVMPLMKLKIKNLKFPIKTILQALGQSDNKIISSDWQVFERNLVLMVGWGWLAVCLT